MLVQVTFTIALTEALWRRAGAVRITVCLPAEWTALPTLWPALQAACAAARREFEAVTRQPLQVYNCFLPEWVLISPSALLALLVAGGAAEARWYDRQFGGRREPVIISSPEEWRFGVRFEREGRAYPADAPSGTHPEPLGYRVEIRGVLGMDHHTGSVDDVRVEELPARASAGDPAGAGQSVSEVVSTAEALPCHLATSRDVPTTPVASPTDRDRGEVYRKAWVQDGEPPIRNALGYYQLAVRVLGADYPLLDRASDRTIRNAVKAAGLPLTGR